MVNQDFIKYIINNPYTDDDKIKNGDFIPHNVINLMSGHDEKDLELCFYKYKTSEREYINNFINAEVVCDLCGEVSYVKFFKTALIHYLANINNATQRNQCLCDKCKQVVDDQRMAERRKKNAENKILAEERQIEEQVHKYYYTNEYIDLYLSPNKQWNDNISPQERVGIIMDENHINNNTIARHINSMNYYDFLKTPYWKAISAHKKFQSNYQCEVCRSKENLNVHHKDHKRHGYEHTSTVFKQDLICLCHDCHERVAHKL